ncbi:hypothetical protein QIS74_13608 [Colletotrichum tabaci]|uniref:Uncharacterized protein n=1 Tax=Colletotrichum tabaci TaxID=1209068 RepID=A0AAV9ST78_9PEZI
MSATSKVLQRVESRLKRVKLCVRAYAEVGSDLETSDEDGAYRFNDDCVRDQANAGKIQLGPQSCENNSAGDCWHQQGSETTTHVITIIIRTKTKVRAGYESTKDKWNYDPAGLSCFHR